MEKLKVNTIEGKEKPSFIVTKELLLDISILHAMVGSTEWSGILLCEIEGSITNPSEMRIIGKRIWPVNIGSEAYTAFQYNAEILKMYDVIPEALNMKEGKVHTHHDMKAGFSPTDFDDLYTNCKHHNYYISLLVKFNMEFECHIAVPVKTSTTEIIVKDESGQEVTLPSVNDESVIHYKAEIVFQYDSYYFDQINVLKEVAVKEKKSRSAVVHHNDYHANLFNQHMGDDDYPFGHTDNNDLEVAALLSKVIMCDMQSNVSILTALNSKILKQVGGKISHLELIIPGFQSAVELNYPKDEDKTRIVLAARTLLNTMLQGIINTKTSKSKRNSLDILDNISTAVQEYEEFRVSKKEIVN